MLRHDIDPLAIALTRYLAGREALLRADVHRELANLRWREAPRIRSENKAKKRTILNHNRRSANGSLICDL
jgi:hypothetical protein